MHRPLSNPHLDQRVALWAATAGLLWALVIAYLGGWLSAEEQDRTATVLGALGFIAVFVSTFLLVIASIRLRDDAQRRAVWLGCVGFTIMLAVLSIFSGAGLIFLFVAGALLWAWFDATRRGEPAGTWLSPLLTLWIAVSLGVALRLLWWRDTPKCWAESNGSSCTSDITDSLEGALALCALAFALAGIIAIL